MVESITEFSPPVYGVPLPEVHSISALNEKRASCNAINSGYVTSCIRGLYCLVLTYLPRTSAPISRKTFMFTVRSGLVIASPPPYK